MKTKIILLVFTIIMFVTGNIFSQTISITSISKTQFCVGDEFTVDYVASGTFEDDNVFVVQLSYPDGNFNNFNNIGNFKSTNSGSITCKIPGNLKTNQAYKLRLMSSEPLFISQEYASFLEIYEYPIPRFKPDSSRILVGNSIKFENTTLKAKSCFWEFGDDAYPPTYDGWTPPEIIYSSAGFKNVKLTAFNDIGCKSSYQSGFEDYKKTICVFSCYPKIDSSVIVVSSDTTIKLYEDISDIWICSSGILNVDFFRHANFFIESGGTLNIDSYLSENGNAIYLKPGACVNLANHIYSNTFVCTKFSSINVNSPYDINKLICDDLQFDYSEAPMEGKIAQHLAVDVNSSLNNLNIFPNPSDGLLNISLNSEVPSFTVTIYDVLGSEIYYENVKNITGTWNKKIDLSGSSKGMYFIKFSNIEKNIIKTIILE